LYSVGILYYCLPLGFTVCPLSFTCPAIFGKPLLLCAEYYDVANFACQRAAWERKRNGGTADYILQTILVYFLDERLIMHAIAMGRQNLILK